MAKLHLTIRSEFLKWQNYILRKQRNLKTAKLFLRILAVFKKNLFNTQHFNYNPLYASEIFDGFFYFDDSLN